MRGRPDEFCVNAIVDVVTVAVPLTAYEHSCGAGSNCSSCAPPPPPHFTSLFNALESLPCINTAIIACPPEFAAQYAEQALQMGIQNVMMEKPPGLDHIRLEKLEKLANNRNATLFTAYHSAYCPCIDQARTYIRQQLSESDNLGIKSIKIEWKESARKWHVGQHWIAHKNGFGVLDTLINPISLLDNVLFTSELLAAAEEQDNNNNNNASSSSSNNSKNRIKVQVDSSVLKVPKNWTTPISGKTNLNATVEHRGGGAENEVMTTIPIEAEYAWDVEDDDDVWNIEFHLRSDENAGSSSVMTLERGGANMTVDVIKNTNGGKQEDGGIGLLSPTVVPTTGDDKESEDFLRTEYEAVYDRFVQLIRQKKSEVRSNPLLVINEILMHSTVIHDVDDYDL